MDIKKRNEKIYESIKDGIKTKNVSEQYGISRSRVWQIYNRIKYVKDNYDKWPPLKKMLSLRSQHVLVNYFKDENILNNPKKAAEKMGIEYLRIRNAGLKTVKEIGCALHNLGLVKSVNKWMARPYDEVRSSYILNAINKKCPYHLSIFSECYTCGYRGVREKCK